MCIENRKGAYLESCSLCVAKSLMPSSGDEKALLGRARPRSVLMVLYRVLEPPRLRVVGVAQTPCGFHFPKSYLLQEVVPGVSFTLLLALKRDAPPV